MRIYPYRRLTSQSVLQSDWLGYVGERDVMLAEEVLRSWDYQTPVRLECDVSIQGELAVSELFGGETGFKATYRVLSGTGGGGRFPKAKKEVFSQVIEVSDDPVTLNIVLEIPSQVLSQSLWLISEILLHEDMPSRDGQEPYIAGTRLWESHNRFRLEGTSSRFPVEARSFKNLGWSKDLGWRLLWSLDDARLPFTTAVRLILDADNPDIFARFENEDKLFVAGVFRSLVQELSVGLLVDENPLDEEEYEEGSMGAVVLSWIFMAFQVDDISAAREMYFRDPSKYMSKLAEVAVGA